ncbi:MAG TPA: amidohydrolase, partial [Abditibacteriaceae bacterium]
MSASLHENFVAPSLDLPWQQDIVALRRDFHAHPELGYEEVRSAAIIAQRLRDLGLEVREGVGGTGVIGILRGAKPGPCVLVRADMDALPVLEANDWQWKSKVVGKMHACGHDAHMATGLTVARLLAEDKENLAGTVKFMFQPAEEGLGGAGRMLDDGLLDEPRPDFALALHVWSEIE